MEPINTNTSNTVQSYQRQKAAPAQPVDPPKRDPAAVPKFISPSGNIDPESGTYSVQIRDTSTGEVRSEYPRKQAASNYSKAASQGQSQDQSQSQSPAPASTGGVESSAVETAVVDAGTGDSNVDVKA